MSRKIKWLALGLGILVLVFTRFMNLSWGLPYPFHPDERNMASAIQQLQCLNIVDLTSCFNPHFFAYGQFPLYLGYVIALLSRIITRIVGAIQFEEAVLSLRFISATASLLTVYLAHKTLRLIIPAKNRNPFFLALFIFSPALIQFAHFGTTESLLMFLFTWIVYLCLKLNNRKDTEDIDGVFIWIGVAVGMAVATKVSSISFFLLPFFAIISARHVSTEKESRYQRFWVVFNELVFVGFITGAVAVLFSPHNLISWNDFIGSMQYESGVASGVIRVFYTTTFTQSVPILFQVQKIFPYTLGLPLFLVFLISFFTIPYSWKNNFLRLSFLVFFIPWAFAYTKWTRFMSPLFPLMVIFVAIFISRLPRRIGIFLTLLCLVPGVQFMKVYISPDVRFTASEWMVHNIPSKSFILQETANVIDLPVLVPNSAFIHKNFRGVSFNFYELENNPQLQKDLKVHIAKADYIIVPSRRIFMNHPKSRYPRLAQYYEKLFSGELGFKKVAEFRVLDDESAEETWTVFDHPVVRIYKRM